MSDRAVTAVVIVTVGAVAWYVLVQLPKQQPAKPVTVGDWRNVIGVLPTGTLQGTTPAPTRGEVGFVEGTVQGAGAGAVGGPWGMAVGAGAGAVASFFL